MAQRLKNHGCRAKLGQLFLTSVDRYLGGSSDHVLDEVPVSRGINDGDGVLEGLELPESNIDGDTSLTLSLEFVKNPGILEGSLQRR